MTSAPVHRLGGASNFSHATLHLSSLITPTSANVHITAANSTVEIDDAGWYHGGLRVGWGNGNTSRALLSLDDAAVVNTGGIDLGETDFTFGQLNVRHAAHTNTW